MTGRRPVGIKTTTGQLQFTGMETTNMATMEYKGYVARIDTDEENDGGPHST